MKRLDHTVILFLNFRGSITLFFTAALPNLTLPPTWTPISPQPGQRLVSPFYSGDGTMFYFMVCFLTVIIL